MQGFQTNENSDGVMKIESCTTAISVHWHVKLKVPLYPCIHPQKLEVNNDPESKVSSVKGQASVELVDNKKRNNHSGRHLTHFM